jgi:hypothetical protein
MGTETRGRVTKAEKKAAEAARVEVEHFCHACQYGGTPVHTCKVEVPPVKYERVSFVGSTFVGEVERPCMFCSEPTMRAFETGEGCCEACAKPIMVPVAI